MAVEQERGVARAVPVESEEGEKRSWSITRRVFQGCLYQPQHAPCRPGSQSKVGVLLHKGSVFTHSPFQLDFAALASGGLGSVTVMATLAQTPSTGLGPELSQML